MNNLNLRAGIIAGLIAVLATTAVNILGRLIGVLPEPLDLKYMSELFIDPASTPTSAFWVGMFLHILDGILVGVIYIWLIKRPTPLNGVGFSLIFVWLTMMLILLPARGRGVFGFSTGPMMPVATLLLTILYGAIVGWVAQKMVFPQDIFMEQIGRALTSALKEAIQAEEQEPVPPFDIATDRIMIFSDLHKGARNGADDFQVAEQPYPIHLKEACQGKPKSGNRGQPFIRILGAGIGH